MDYTTGELKSAWKNGSDVKILISTDLPNKNWDIDTNDEFIFYSSAETI